MLYWGRKTEHIGTNGNLITTSEWQISFLKMLVLFLFRFERDHPLHKAAAKGEKPGVLENMILM